MTAHSTGSETRSNAYFEDSKASDVFFLGFVHFALIADALR